MKTDYAIINLLKDAYILRTIVCLYCFSKYFVSEMNFDSKIRILRNLILFLKVCKIFYLNCNSCNQ